MESLLLVALAGCGPRPQIALTPPRVDLASIDAFIATQEEYGPEYRPARQIATGDLTGDGDPETVALYTLEFEGGNGYSQHIAVFTRRQGTLSALTSVHVGGKAIRSIERVSIARKVIRLSTLDFGPDDPLCCPSRKGTASYILDGETLRERDTSAPDAAWLRR